MTTMCAFYQKSQRPCLGALQVCCVLCFALIFLLCGFSMHAHAKYDHARQLALRACKAGVNMPTSSHNTVHVARKPVLSQNISWLCYYGFDRSVLTLHGYELYILEADAIGPLTPKDKAGRICIAYMSIGEIVQSRWFWPEVKDKPWFLEENSEWIGAHRIDLRNVEWIDLLVNKVAPALLLAGYDGFLLDNVDAGEYLENKDPVRYEGASMAAAEIIRRLCKNYPDAVIIANGGLSTAAEVASCLTAVVSESTFSTWLSNADGTFSYAEISSQSKAWLRPHLLRIRGVGLPVLALEYVDPYNLEEQQRVREAVKQAGYHPYIAERSLMHFPGNHGLPSKEY